MSLSDPKSRIVFFVFFLFYKNPRGRSVHVRPVGSGWGVFFFFSFLPFPAGHYNVIQEGNENKTSGAYTKTDSVSSCVANGPL
jgi:hypothetical protein